MESTSVDASSRCEGGTTYQGWRDILRDTRANMKRLRKQKQQKDERPHHQLQTGCGWLEDTAIINTDQVTEMVMETATAERDEQRSWGNGSSSR